MRVFNFNDKIINCDDDDPQIARLEKSVSDRSGLIASIEQANLDGVANYDSELGIYNDSKEEYDALPEEEKATAEEPLPPVAFVPKDVPEPLSIEELDLALFNGKESYANSTNTAKVDGVWTFDESAVDQIIEAAKAESISVLENSIIDLSIKKDKADALGMTERSAEIQASLDDANAKLAALTQ